MQRFFFFAILFFCPLLLIAQHNSIVFKKKNQTINNYWIGSSISFQTKDKQWQKGAITRITKDSFYIRPTYVRYGMMDTDTVSFNIMGFSIYDIYALPKNGVQIDFIDGSFKISRSGGHVRWYWIKSGWIFRTGAIGYAALNVTNGIINNDFSIKDDRLKAAAGIFLFGLLLKQTYKAYLPVGKRYTVKILSL